MHSERSPQTISDQLDALQSELQKMKTALRSLNIKAAKLNIDLISTIDPKNVHQVNENEKICNDCYQRCESRCAQEHFVSQTQQEAMKVEVVVSEKEE